MAALALILEGLLFLAGCYIVAAAWWLQMVIRKSAASHGALRAVAGIGLGCVAAQLAYSVYGWAAVVEVMLRYSSFDLSTVFSLAAGTLPGVVLLALVATLFIMVLAKPAATGYRTAFVALDIAQIVLRALLLVRTAVQSFTLPQLWQQGAGIGQLGALVLAVAGLGFAIGSLIAARHFPGPAVLRQVPPPVPPLSGTSAQTLLTPSAQEPTQKHT